MTDNENELVIKAVEIVMSDKTNGGLGSDNSGERWIEFLENFYHIFII